ncbi:MAG: hypothetical protein H7256_09455 [Bdellovibrio sp.]|nr:hypothetical protein [Bdellovibrio sp.]
MNLISDDISGRCEDRCEVESCWLETKTLTVCSVQFSALDKESQKRVLTTSANALKEKGLSVGFCGHDATSTKVTGSSFRSTGGSAFAGASGGTGAPFASGTASTTLTNQVSAILANSSDDKAMMQACHSRPVDN